MMTPTEIIVPMIAAGVAVFSSVVKNWSARKSGSEIVINFGNGSRITVDGSEESREKLRKILSVSLESSGLGSTEDSHPSYVPESKSTKREGEKLP